MRINAEQSKHPDLLRTGKLMSTFNMFGRFERYSPRRDVRVLENAVRRSAAEALASRSITSVWIVHLLRATVLQSHRLSQKIWVDTAGEVDVFVAAVGTGGTLMGVASVLKERRPKVRIIAVEPAASAVLSGGTAGQHSIPGIGVGFVPPLFDRGLVDEIVAVSDEDAFAAMRLLARREGISAGISAGAAVHASLVTMKRPDMSGKTVVTILPDPGDRYVSSDLFNDSNQASVASNAATDAISLTLSLEAMVNEWLK